MWFRSYLSNRLQYIEIKNTDGSVKTSCNSSCRKVKYGAKLVLYADDTNLLITGKDEPDLQYKIMNVMKELEIWYQKNNLVINTKKTFVMSFHSKQQRDPLRPQ